MMTTPGRRPPGRAGSDGSQTARPDGMRPRRPPWRSGDFVLLAVVVAVLNIIGLVMVLSASSVDALSNYGSSWFFFKRQLLWVAGGVFALVFTMRIDYRRWRRWAVPSLLTGLVLLLAVLLPGVGMTVSGSRRWLGTGSWQFQPSEIMKLALVLWAADLLARRSDQIDDWRHTLRPVLIVFVLIAALVMKEPDMGTTAVLACIVLAVLYVGGVRLSSMMTVLGGGVTLAGLAAMAAPYRRARLTSFVHPFADKTDKGYQLVQSLVGLASGGVAGVGLGASRAKWGFLPNAHTDFIFSIIGEELGLIGTIVVVALFAVLGYLGVRTAVRAPDRFGTLLAAGITAWIIGEAVINVGGVIGLLPDTGVPLPFVSFGGSSLLLAMGAMGMVLNVASQEQRGGRPARGRPPATA